MYNSATPFRVGLLGLETGPSIIRLPCASLAFLSGAINGQFSMASHSAAYQISSRL
nr:MAG TPA: hypothetical protein [Bacteriophage sp.]